MFGIPKILKSYNGPPFNSKEFKEFADNFGFKHRKITPLWPRANVKSERFMKTLGKAIRAAFIEHRSWKQEIHAFLRNYRTTKHTTTGCVPSEVMFKRQVNTKIPSFNNRKKSDHDHMIRIKDSREKRKMKDNFENKRSIKLSDIYVGDSVLVKQDKKDKLTTPFSPKPFTVERKKGTMITAKNKDSEQITRNASFFKKIENRILEDEEVDKILDTFVTTPGETQTVRKSNRIRRRPTYLNDYVCK